MGVNHRCLHVLVLQQLLHCANVLAIDKQVRGEGMPKVWLVARFVKPASVTASRTAF